MACSASNMKFSKDINISFENITYSTKIGLFKRSKYFTSLISVCDGSLVMFIVWGLKKGGPKILIFVVHRFFVPEYLI